MINFLILFALIILNGIFAMSEIALVSAKESRVEPKAKEGSSAARVALQQMDSPNDFLSTIQVGITLIGVSSGALGGRSLANQIEPWVAQVPLLAPYSDTISLVATVSLITYLSLVIGELVPKRLALNSPERITVWVARPMRWLSRVAAPLVWLLSTSTDLVVRLLRVQPSEEPPVTEEEMKRLLEQGMRAGVFEQTEKEVVRRALDLDDRRVTSVMTPHPAIKWLDLSDDEAEIRRTVMESGFARLPVIEGNPNDVLGIVRANELLTAWADGQEVELRDHLYQPAFVPISASPTETLEHFRRSQLHTVLVVDEYGSVVGLITPTDILEFIVGQLPSLELPMGPEPTILEREDGSWLIDGMIAIRDLESNFSDQAPFAKVDTRIQTLNGFIMQQLARIPNEGETLEWEGYKFQVVDMDGRRVDKVLMWKTEPADEASENDSFDNGNRESNNAHALNEEGPESPNNANQRSQ